MTDLTCELSLTRQADGDIGLAFDVLNPGDEPAGISFFRPFLGFELAVHADDGPVPVVQPAYSVGVAPAALTLRPGASTRIETPVRLRFEPDAPPGDEPTRWSLRHEPVPVRVEATLMLNGQSVGPCEARFEP